MQPILATKPFLPPLKEYEAYIQDMWKTGWLTNNSKYVQELEGRLRDYLGIPHLSLVNNGTIAIQIGIKALDLKGEIITTPFSYVATTSSIVWESCTPVFADIEPDTFCLDPEKIEERITPRTSAILATHVYGNPCNVERIDQIAKKYGLNVIYDAAHAFGVMLNGRSILEFGDVSTLSFHATKLFHTIEGGAVVGTDEKVAEIMEYQRRFGHDGPYAFHGLGINAKLSEPHAAMGLCVLNHMEDILAKRREQWEYYETMIRDIGVKSLRIREGAKYNYSYFPVRLRSEAQLLRFLEKLESDQVYPRRYFYPSLNKLNYVSSTEMPVSEKVSRTTVCLPLFHDLERHTQDLIVRKLFETLHT